MTNNAPLTDEQRELAAAHVRLAGWFAKTWSRKYPRRWDEINSAAMLGLVHAARSFDPSIGSGFPKFARKRIAGEIKDARREWELKGFKGATDPAVAPRRHPLDTALELTAEEPFDDCDAFEDRIRVLPDRLRVVCRMRYLNGMTGREIAAKLGISESGVSVRHDAAIRLLHPDGHRPRTRKSRTPQLTA